MLTLIQNAQAYAPEPLGISDLLIGGGRILALGKGGSIDAGCASTTDLEGRRVIPGLIDGHAHLTGGGGESGFSSRVPPLAIGNFTRHGITSAVGVLGTDDTTRDTRSLVAAACGLREEGLGAWCHTGSYRVPPVTLTGDVRDDIVFVDPVIGVGELAISDHRSSQPTIEELMRIASDAHVAGLIARKAGILHLHVGDGPRGLELIRQILATSELPPRVFNPTHVNRRKALFEEAIELARQGCTIDITAFPVDDGEDAWPADAAIRRYLDAGADPAKVTVSSDGGGCLPIYDSQGQMLSADIGSPASLLTTLQSLLKSGLALEQALPAFTSNVSTLLRLERRGRIAVGAHADLVVLDEEDGVCDVMAGGRWHLQNGDPQVAATFL